jgi:hypothetical protein
VSSTLAPEITAFEESAINPVTVPRLDWPVARKAILISKKAEQISQPMKFRSEEDTLLPNT